MARSPPSALARASTGRISGNVVLSEHVQVIPHFEKQEIWPGVMDERGSILWAPNPGQPPQPLDKIASGGELSRFLLALASVRQDGENAIFIFDEVDAGVGGLTLNKLAEKPVCARCKQSNAAYHALAPAGGPSRKYFQMSNTVRDDGTYRLY